MRPLRRFHAKQVEKWEEGRGATAIRKRLEFEPYGSAAGALARNFGQVCAYCEAPVTGSANIEHIDPKSGTGSETDWENLLISCGPCNSAKGTKDLPWNPLSKNFWQDFSYQYNTDETDILLKPLNPDATEYIELFCLNNRPGRTTKTRAGFVAPFGAAPRRRRIVAGLAERGLGLGIPIEEMVSIAECTGFWTVWVTTLMKKCTFAKDAVNIAKEFVFSDSFPGTDLSKLTDAIENEWLAPALFPKERKAALTKLSTMTNQTKSRKTREVTPLGGKSTAKVQRSGAATPTKTNYHDMIYEHTPASSRLRKSL